MKSKELAETIEVVKRRLKELECDKHLPQALTWIWDECGHKLALLLFLVEQLFEG